MSNNGIISQCPGILCTPYSCCSRRIIFCLYGQLRFARDLFLPSWTGPVSHLTNEILTGVHWCNAKINAAEETQRNLCHRQLSIRISVLHWLTLRKNSCFIKCQKTCSSLDGTSEIVQFWRAEVTTAVIRSSSVHKCATKANKTQNVSVFLQLALLLVFLFDSQGSFCLAWTRHCFLLTNQMKIPLLSTRLKQTTQNF